VAAATPAVDDLWLNRALGARSSSTLVHAPVASGLRFLWVSVSLADFCNL